MSSNSIKIEMNKEDDEIKINYDSIFTDRTNNDENLV